MDSDVQNFFVLTDCAFVIIEYKVLISLDNHLGVTLPALLLADWFGPKNWIARSSTS